MLTASHSKDQITNTSLAEEIQEDRSVEAESFTNSKNNKRHGVIGLLKFAECSPWNYPLIFKRQNTPVISLFLVYQ